MAGDPAASPIVSLASSSATARQWWTSFNSADLNALVDQALKGNPTLQQADAALVRVYASWSARRGAIADRQHD
jgi:outer membrane protein TolC